MGSNEWPQRQSVPFVPFATCLEERRGIGTGIKVKSKEPMTEEGGLIGSERDRFGVRSHTLARTPRREEGTTKRGVGPRKAGLQFDRSSSGEDSLVNLLCRKRKGSVDFVSFGKCRMEPKESPANDDCLSGPSARLENCDQNRVSLGGRRVEPKCFVASRNSLAELPNRPKGNSEIRVRLREDRLKEQGLAMSEDCFDETPLGLECIAEVIMCLSQIRIDSNRFLAGSDSASRVSMGK